MGKGKDACSMQRGIHFPSFINAASLTMPTEPGLRWGQSHFAMDVSSLGEFKDDTA